MSSMFMLLETDSFDSRAADTGKDVSGRASTDPKRDKERAIRRPYRGIQIKEDTYAVISLRKPDGTPIRMLSSSKVGLSEITGEEDGVSEYADFILQQIDESRQEKQQIIETFGAPYIYFYGERPRLITMNGLLMNTEDFNWRSQFWENYDKFMRGSKLAQLNARAYLAYDTIVIEGYPLSAQAQDSAENPYHVSFQMTMVVTNYHDYSNIGSQRFPGKGAEQSLDVLNEELEFQSGKYVSTTAAVRSKNLTGGYAGNSVLAGIRRAIRAVSDLSTSAFGFIGGVSTVLAGRNVRVPIGVAGYLASLGDVQIAAGSIRTAGSSALMARWDAATGTYKGVNGSVRLRVPGLSKYAPSWTSEIAFGSDRGYIFENRDEYPLRYQPESLMTLTTLTQYQQIKQRQEMRKLMAEESEIQLAILQESFEAEGVIGGTIADSIAMAKANFGMLMNAGAMAVDPTAVALAALGIGIGVERGQTGKNITRDLKTGKFLKATLGKYLGFAAGSTIANLAQRIAGTYEPKNVGDIYTSQGYQSTNSQSGLQAGRNEGDTAYEDSYGNKDYSDLTAASPESRSALSSVHGDVDESTTAAAQPESLEEVYGTGSSKPVNPSAAEQAAVLENDQSGGEQPSDEDTSGIRGVEEDDAPIEPVT